MTTLNITINPHLVFMDPFQEDINLVHDLAGCFVRSEKSSGKAVLYIPVIDYMRTNDSPIVPLLVRLKYQNIFQNLNKGKPLSKIKQVWFVEHPIDPVSNVVTEHFRRKANNQNEASDGNEVKIFKFPGDNSPDAVKLEAPATLVIELELMAKGNVFQLEGIQIFANALS